MIRNGCGPTSQQALSQDTPALGITSNLVNWLHVSAVATAGAGLRMHAYRLKPEALPATGMQRLANPSFRMAAGKVSEYITANEAAERFPAFIQSCLAGVTISTNGHGGSTTPENERRCRRVRSLSR
ncbi:UDP-glucoronosyl and UDP-glucosyltransferases family protein [Sulfuricella sp. T08]|uniref:hypothetical protein n=1 Tax=Sulfuricella sp. T08 TaxID=1632857 RepID=UPI000617A156|nr:hypothetical protein [Sulfuricella sp. T08]GAO34899.1 UDP-glucoronosyl and UDP-glucosyltransferases family protein [Sulfuricella sp. T08]